MIPRRSIIAMLASATLLSGQSASIVPVRADAPSWLQPYQAATVPAARIANSSRLGGLLRAGSLYLTVQDAIALALENNVDIEVARYGPIMADWRLERARAGGALPGVPSSAGQAGSVAAGQGVTGSQAAAGVGGGGGGGGGRGGTNAAITQIGPITQNLDPVFQQTTTFSHVTTPQSNAVQSQTFALVAGTRVYTTSVQQGLLSGGTITLSFRDNYLRENSPTNVFNPSTAANLSLTWQHSLLRGFGIAVNSRTITVSKINVRTSDVTFKTRVIGIVTQVLNQYYGLAAAREDLRAKAVAADAALTLFENVKRQVDIGAIAPTEVIRTEAQVATTRQALVASQSTVETQEVRLKNVLSRNGLAEPALAAARIVLLDKIVIPAADDLPSIDDLVREAREKRGDIELDKANLESARISGEGTKNGILPTLVVFGAESNAGLAGETQRSVAAGPGATGDYFVGGFGKASAQVFRRNFPTNRVGVYFQAPIGNRQATADQTIDQLQLRQTELGAQKRLQQIEVDVRNAVVALTQARARYNAAVKNMVLQEELVRAEQRRFDLGSSTPQNVLLQQRDLAAAQSSEAAALATYSNARVALDQTVGRTLEANNVAIAEAREGKVARASSVPDAAAGR